MNINKALDQLKQFAARPDYFEPIHGYVLDDAIEVIEQQQRIIDQLQSELAGNKVF